MELYIIAKIIKSVMENANSDNIIYFLTKFINIKQSEGKCYELKIPIHLIFVKVCL